MVRYWLVPSKRTIMVKSSICTSNFHNRIVDKDIKQWKEIFRLCVYQQAIHYKLPHCWFFPSVIHHNIASFVLLDWIDSSLSQHFSRWAPIRVDDNLELPLPPLFDWPILFVIQDNYFKLISCLIPLQLFAFIFQPLWIGCIWAHIKRVESKLGAHFVHATRGQIIWWCVHKEKVLVYGLY